MEKLLSVNGLKTEFHTKDGIIYVVIGVSLTNGLEILKLYLDSVVSLIHRIIILHIHIYRRCDTSLKV